MPARCRQRQGWTSGLDQWDASTCKGSHCIEKKCDLNQLICEAAISGTIADELRKCSIQLHEQLSIGAVIAWSLFGRRFAALLMCLIQSRYRHH
jgi:hypothetical protein